MKNTIGHRKCERALSTGRVFNPEQALNIGLVDELVENNELIAIAEKRMKHWCKIPSNIKKLF